LGNDVTVKNTDLTSVEEYLKWELNSQIKHVNSDFIKKPSHSTNKYCQAAQF
jgi:hypothetical protein